MKRPAPDQDEVRRALEGRHALLVTPDPALEALCVVLLHELGLIVDVVASGVDAVVAARRRPVDVLVVDTQLEDVPGRQAVGWLRGNPALRERLILLLVDGAPGAAQIQTSGSTAVLRKPVNMAALVAAVAEMRDSGRADTDDMA